MVTDSLYLATKTMKPKLAASMGKDKNEQIKASIIEIYGHDWNCLIGYYGENAPQYKALIKK